LIPEIGCISQRTSNTPSRIWSVQRAMFARPVTPLVKIGHTASASAQSYFPAPNNSH